MELKESISSFSSSFDTLAQIMEKLVDIDDGNGYDFINFAKQSKLLEDKDSLYKLLCCINQATQIRPMNLETYHLIVSKLIPKINEFFSSDDLAIIFKNKYIVLLLVQKKLIQMRTLIDNFLDDIDFLQYFYEEFKKEDEEWVNLQIKYFPEVQSFAQKFNAKKHHELRKISQNEDEFATFIRNNDIDSLVTFVSMTDRPINKPIYHSIYERNDKAKDITPIEYAALCGSLDVFKFFWTHDADVSYKLMFSAISGGNYDIIHIVESKFPVYDSELLKYAVKMHRSDIFDYISETHNVKFDIECLMDSISNFNYKYFKEFAPKVIADINEKISDTTLLHTACQYGNIEVVRSLVRINGIDPNIRDDKGKTALHLAARGGYMEIVKNIVKYTRVNIEAKDKHSISLNIYNTALHLAALFCRFDVVRFLSSLKKINVNSLDRVSLKI